MIIGAGAAGPVAALFAARRGLDVLLLERTADGGRKILISGGGRCNVLPSELAPERFVTASSPHTLRKILTSWPQPEQRRFFEQDLGLPLVCEAETGKLFPASQKAREVRDRLLAHARSAGAELRFGMTVERIEPLVGQGFRVHCQARGSETEAVRIDAGAIVLATGGLSVPTTGSDGLGFEFARSLGHVLHPTYPALTPLTGGLPAHAELAGIALRVTIRSAPGLPRFETTDAFLFTHRGYSGPAVLDASHLAVLARRADQPCPLRIQWTADAAAEWERALRSGAGHVVTVLNRSLPQRLARQLLAEAAIPPETPLARLDRHARARIVALLTAYCLPVSGDEGYRKAEVTGGGVPLGDVDSRTLESRRRPGLYFCGEVLDACGPIGGHNFSWAWATGRLVGLSIAASRGPDPGSTELDAQGRPG